MLVFSIILIKGGGATPLKVLFGSINSWMLFRLSWLEEVVEGEAKGLGFDCWTKGKVELMLLLFWALLGLLLRLLLFEVLLANFCKSDCKLFMSDSGSCMADSGAGKLTKK